MGGERGVIVVVNVIVATVVLAAVVEAAAFECKLRDMFYLIGIADNVPHCHHTRSQPFLLFLYFVEWITSMK